MGGERAWNWRKQRLRYAVAATGLAISVAFFSECSGNAGVLTATQHYPEVGLMHVSGLRALVFHNTSN
jgi:hypothetical protein